MNIMTTNSACMYKNLIMVVTIKRILPHVLYKIVRFLHVLFSSNKTSDEWRPHVDQYINDCQSFNRLVCLRLPAFRLGLLCREEKENQQTLKWYNVLSKIRCI